MGLVAFVLVLPHHKEICENPVGGRSPVPRHPRYIVSAMICSHLNHLLGGAPSAMLSMHYG